MEIFLIYLLGSFTALLLTIERLRFIDNIKPSEYADYTKVDLFVIFLCSWVSLLYYNILLFIRVIVPFLTKELFD